MIYDTFIGYTLGNLLVVDPLTFEISAVQTPMYIEDMLTLSLLENKMFLVFKQLNDASFDRP